MKRLFRDTSISGRENLISFSLILPFLIIFCIFLLYPIIYSLILSFHRVTDLYDVFGGLKLVGGRNYTKLFHDVEFWWAILMTLYYAALSIPIGIVFSFLLAVFLVGRIKGSRIFRTCFFLPFVLDVFVVAIVWTLLYSSPYGIVMKLFELIGLKIPPLLSTPATSMPAIVAAMTLKNAGFGMILFIASINNIPQSLYEAASIDGVSGFAKHRYITIPLIKPVILFLVVTGTIASLSAFAEFYGMTRDGGPMINLKGNIVGITRVTGMYLFREFRSLKLGYAAAISFVLLIISLTISLISFRLLRER
ncbi:sugar ABC transporter permease [candidate division WOR-3 bacterium]|nr:sugar ABC transporter permease [candidate division WOR-3 bacterium]